MEQEATVVEHDTDYFEQVIIDHPMHGRLYAAQMKEHEAMLPTWRDGLAFKVLPTDTLESINALKGKIVNDYQTTAYEMMWWDYDKQRRIIIWPGDMIENMIVSALRRAGIYHG